MPEPLRELIVVGLIALVYYLGAAMTFIALALMLAGPMAAQSTAAFFIGTPFLWICAVLANGIAASLSFLGSALAVIARSVVTYLVDPLLRPIAYLIRVLIAGRPQ